MGLLWSSAFFSIALSGLVHQAAAASPDFAVGQEWSIKSSTAKAVIGRIESWKDKTAVHVSIVDIPPSLAAARANQLTRIDHMPFEKSALAASVSKLLSTDVPPSPNFEAGYKRWKEQNGGIFSISVTQAIGVVGHEILDQHAE